MAWVSPLYALVEDAPHNYCSAQPYATRLEGSELLGKLLRESNAGAEELPLPLHQKRPPTHAGVVSAR
jgi:hypothetical protein